MDLQRVRKRLLGRGNSMLECLRWILGKADLECKGKGNPLGEDPRLQFCTLKLRGFLWVDQ